MARFGRVIIHTEVGPVFRAGLDVLEYAVEILKLLPDCCEEKKKELANRGRALEELMRKRLKARKCEGGNVGR